MQTSDIRKKYLAYFEQERHVIVPSAPLVPENDPTTLFTGSGMQPIVPYLLGAKHPLGTRITDSQKCFRSQDIEEVGDNRHTTFFEMLGNWSFGDYFKTEQINWMWGFLTSELGLDPKRLYFTCFRGNDELGIPRDTESAERWQTLFKSVGIEATIGEDSEKNGMRPGERIFYYSEKKNWWSRAGVPANMPVGEPGGPDTEMFWDFGEEFGLHEKSVWAGENCHVNCDCGRFMEIGNNVFMEYKKTENGFEKLAQQNVDFGGGLERMAAALANDPDVFKLDLFGNVRNMMEELSGKKYGDNQELIYAFRVVMDHIRASTFLISDGVTPSNTDRGYALRRLLRRAVRFSDMIGIKEGNLATLAYAVVETYREAYPEMVVKSGSIVGEIDKEEEKFRESLSRGLKKFNDGVESHLDKKLTGVLLWNLFQTEGFPLEVSLEIAKERNIDLAPEAVDLFNKLKEQHQDLSRTASAGKFKGGLADHSAKVTALHTSTHLMLAGLRKELGPDVHQAGSNITEERTRFDFTYPEKVPREVLDRVEVYVNTAIAANATVGTTVMEKEAAKANGVEGSFWEKYPEKVTVYQVAGPDGTIYSQELCGGPHVVTTADIAAFGRFKIIKEEASSAGVRRVKAVLE